ncbi:MAG: altronate dehydratase family protein [Planctomycetota bacterium]
MQQFVSLAVFKLHAKDNVAIAARALGAFESVQLADGSSVRTVNPVPAGHKLAVDGIGKGDPVYKYGQRIGEATKVISPGEHVHSHNLADRHDLASQVTETYPPSRPTAIEREFQGFIRRDGRVGTRNYVAILSTVNCSATVCDHVARRFDAERLRRWPNVDGVFAATHSGGCALQYGGRKHQMLAATMAGYATHPNIGGCLVIGLGCEQNTPGFLAEHHGIVPIHGPDGRSLESDGTPTLIMQSEGGTRATIDAAEKQIERVLDQANRQTRSTVSASHLKLAVECGGSDGYSGITANPAIGVASDLVVACGGTSILSETTELFGAEHLLCERSRSPDVANKLLDRLRWWQDYVAHYGGQLDHNPSVGNKAGGLTTITEKSLGAVSKGGQTALEDVVDYAGRVDTPGLVVMDTPGFDPSSVTGKVAGGANVVLFSTGRGSCFGCKPVPVIKVASNEMLFESMRDDMDLNAGTILTGRSVEQVGESFFERVLRVASGEKTASERHGFGDFEFVPWTVGPVL